MTGPQFSASTAPLFGYAESIGGTLHDFDAFADLAAPLRHGRRELEDRAELLLRT
ncbi:hypothetical protein EV578_115124 [Streptomyces sp. BK205]|nr:hypothetical protein EV578_115124 [Streptomyces sp. BK205]